jgi:undecaprenyl-diphosphatase
MLFAALAATFLILWALVYATRPAIRRVRKILDRLIARSKRVTRYKSYLPVLAILVAGALLAAWAGDGFMDLAESVRAKSIVLQRSDASVHDWVIGERNSGATFFFTIVTNIGSPVGITVVLAIVALVLAVGRRWRWILYVVVTASGGWLLENELKRYFARARPAVAEMLRHANGYSFPSGHAMGSAVACGAMAYLAFRAIKSWPLTAAVIAFLYTFVAAVALSRVYLGVHWISDVVAGVTAGTVWVTTTTVAYETMRRIRSARSKE